MTFIAGFVFVVCAFCVYPLPTLIGLCFALLWIHPVFGVALALTLYTVWKAIARELPPRE